MGDLSSSTDAESTLLPLLTSLTETDIIRSFDRLVKANVVKYDHNFKTINHHIDGLDVRSPHLERSH